MLGARPVLDALAAPAAACDGRGRVVAANAAMAALLGESAEALIGRVLPAGDGEREVRRADGSGVPVVASAGPFADYG